jgi:signal transduction histidine kinase
MSTQNAEVILIVDDVPANLDVISEALSDAGYEVAIATSGERALKRVQINPPDLILLDVMMPGIDGFETCRQFKADAQTRTIPIIFMTALSDSESKVEGFELGAVDYITKPFQESEVLARVRTHLQLRYLNRNLEQQVAQRTSELSQALRDLQASQGQLVQSEKMSALGSLVAGIAHEINNPVGFVQGNIAHTETYMQSLLEIIDIYQQEYPNATDAIAQVIEDHDLTYLREDLPQVIGSMQQGIERIRDISVSLRTFSREDNDRLISFNIHDGLDSTLLLLKHRLKSGHSRPAIEVIKRYGKLPDVNCYPSQLNQVFMNLLANAIDALDEGNGDRPYEQICQNPNQIVIETDLSEAQDEAIIRIKDNGAGMSEEVRHKIFDFYFTTKGVGKGTGLGLAITRQIINEKHGGLLSVNSSLGQGAEFVIRLPLNANLLSL